MLINRTGQRKTLFQQSKYLTYLVPQLKLERNSVTQLKAFPASQAETSGMGSFFCIM